MKTSARIEAQPIHEIDSSQMLGYWIKGHRKRSEVIDAIEDYGGPLSDDELKRLDAGTQRHCYARVVGDWSKGERQSVLQWFPNTGPGAFPVTVWEY
jgi:hypothetical protein